MSERVRFEEAGYVVSEADHWELVERPIYVVKRKGHGNHYYANVQIPADIVRHLNLKHKEVVLVALKKKDDGNLEFEQ